MKQILVTTTKREFKLTLPDDAKITFGPWSPPSNREDGYGGRRNTTGTLRIYQGSKENIIGCFADVTEFRELSMGYAEKVAREEGATIWKDDEKGYVRESKVSRSEEWVEPVAMLTAAKVSSPKKGAARKR